MGTKKLDAIANEDVQRLKVHLKDKAPKTVNNVLTVLNTLLRVAVEWDVIAPSRVESDCCLRRCHSRNSTTSTSTNVSSKLRGVDARAHLAVLFGGRPDFERAR